MVDVLTIIGTVASVIGGGIAIWQAYLAKEYAEVAKEVEKSITHHRETSEISILKESLHQCIKKVKVYGPGGIEADFKSSNHEFNASQVQDFCLLLTENIDCFEDEEQKFVISAKDEVYSKLSQFNDSAISDNQRKKVGSEILATLSMLSAKFRTRLNKKIEEA